MFFKMGLLDGMYKEKMKAMNKPFYSALHYPALMPHQKLEEPLPQAKHPNLNVNQQVFNRLYDRALAENQTKTIIHQLVTQPQKHMIVLNKDTGLADLEEQSGYTRLDRLVGNNSGVRSAAGGLRAAQPANPKAERLPLTSALSKRSPLGPISYLAREKSKLSGEPKKKITWEGLEKMNVSELKGIANEQFDPASLIGNEDEEDKLYMKEYTSATEFTSVKESSEPVKARRLEAYGEIRKPRDPERDSNHIQISEGRTVASPQRRPPIAKSSASNYK